MHPEWDPSTALRVEALRKAVEVTPVAENTSWYLSTARKFYEFLTSAKPEVVPIAISGDWDEKDIEILARALKEHPQGAR